MKVKDMMIPVADCAKVPEDRTVYDAILMLEAWRQRQDRMEYRPRFVLVYDHEYKIVASLRHSEILKAFAPPSSKMGTPEQPAEACASACREDELALYRDVLASLSQKARETLIKDVMFVHNESQCIDQEAPVSEALCKMLAGPWLSLIVKSGDTTTGVLRMSDVFSVLCRNVTKAAMQ
jgi:hypothetical protein